jgi:chromosome segregation ATPase
VRQKTEQCQRYFDICGDAPTNSALREALCSKLTDIDQQMKESRLRIKDLRGEAQDLDERKQEFGILETQISESKKRIVDLRSEIDQQTESISSKKVENSPAAKTLSDAQRRRDEIRLRLSEHAKLLDSSRSESAALKDRQEKLQEQLFSLQNRISASRKEIADVKQYLSSPVVTNLQKEVSQLEQDLDKACVVPVVLPDSPGPEDLDRGYTDQIEALSSKVDQLRSVFHNSRAKALEAENAHAATLADRKSQLEALREQNNQLRSQVEATRQAVKESVRPLTQELEMWQQKLQDEKRSADKQERECRGRREQRELEVREADAKLSDLKTELARVRAVVRQQTETNEGKQATNHQTRQELEELRAQSLDLESAIASKTEEIERLKTQIESQTQAMAAKQGEIRERDELLSATIRDLEARIESTVTRIQALPVSPVATTHMTEDEVRQSFFALEKEFSARTAALAGIHAAYSRAEGLRARFEAALGLMSELEDEEVFMTSELKMLRSQFAETLRALRSR